MSVLSIFSGEMNDLKILQSDWLEAFWPISQEQEFFPNMGFVREPRIYYKYSLQNKLKGN